MYLFAQELLPTDPAERLIGAELRALAPGSSRPAGPIERDSSTATASGADSVGNGSGSQGPTYCSRCVLAERNWSMQRWVTTAERYALGERTSEARCQRR